MRQCDNCSVNMDVTQDTLPIYGYVSVLDRTLKYIYITSSFTLSNIHMFLLELPLASNPTYHLNFKACNITIANDCLDAIRGLSILGKNREISSSVNNQIKKYFWQGYVILPVTSDAKFLESHFMNLPLQHLQL